MYTSLVTIYIHVPWKSDPLNMGQPLNKGQIKTT